MCRSGLTVIVLTYNEARHIERCIASVMDIATKIIVVDSFSTDATVELASAAGSQVVQHAFINQAKQFQWAIDSCDITTDWVMRLDADEVIEDDLRAAIARELGRLPPDVVGINLDRKHVFMNRWIRHGGRYPVTLLRIWRRGHAHVEDRWMDEHILVSGGRTVSLNGGFADINLNDLTFFTAKHNDYATREAVEQLVQRYNLLDREGANASGIASRQMIAKRLLKEKIYNKLPLWVGPTTYFLYRYILQLGFLDGRAGLVYHFLQGFWYRFLVGAKAFELEREIADCPSNEARIIRIQQVTGIKLTRIL